LARPECHEWHKGFNFKNQNLENAKSENVKILKMQNLKNWKIEARF